MSSIDEQVFELFDKGADYTLNSKKFEELAFKRFEEQYSNSDVYRAFCDSKGKNPDNVNSIWDIPTIIEKSFKQYKITSFPVEYTAKIHRTSGTTENSEKGEVYLDDTSLKMLKRSSVELARTYYNFGEAGKDRDIYALFLGPPPELASDKAVIIHIDAMAGEFATDTEYYIGKEGPKTKKLMKDLQRYEEEGGVVHLGAPSFAFVNLMKEMDKKGIRFDLPEGSVIGDGGGYKGLSEEVPRDEFLDMINEFFGIPASHVPTVYAMTECNSMAPYNSLYNHVKGIEKEPRYVSPPWRRISIRDPETLEESPKGEPGVIRHIDLTNKGHVIAIQTKDIGIDHGEGFEMLGREKGAESRGCSLEAASFAEAQE